MTSANMSAKKKNSSPVFIAVIHIILKAENK